MNNTEVMQLLDNPEIFEINRLKPRSYRNDRFKVKTYLNGKYDLYFYGNLDNRKEEYSEYLEKNKNEIIVPSNVELCGFGDLQYVNTQYPWDGIEDVELSQAPRKTNYGFVYKRNFEFFKNSNSARQVLAFEGVESCFLVTLNGNFVGYAKDSFTTSEFEISEYLTDGQNELIIEVFKYSATSFMDDQDFWRLSGIFRDVYIISETEDEIIDYELNYNLNLEDRSVEGEVTFTTNSEFPIELKIFDENNQHIFTNTGIKECTFNLKNVSLWSAEIPTLYCFKIFRSGEQLMEKNVGFRKIKIKNNIMLFNGKKLNLKGINRHEFDAKKGRAISVDDIRKDLELLKESNFNAIRTSHYPNNTKFYDLCDEIGFYVMDEANLETHGTWSVCDVVEKDYNKILPNENKVYYEAVKDRIINMYERDKNSTSVIFWSLGNESFGGQTLLDMNNLLIELDSSRLCHYEGTTWDRRFDETSQIESQMYTHSEVVQKQLDEKVFAKPFILCEFSHAMGNSIGDYHHYLELERKNQQYNGGFIWEYMDQSIIIDRKEYYGGDFGDYPNDYNFICDGLVGANRSITNELLYVKNLLSPISVEKNDSGTYIKNDNLFKAYNDLVVNTYKVNGDNDQLVNSKCIELDCGEVIKIEEFPGNTYVQVESKNKVLKSFNINSEKFYKTEKEKSEVRFVDGNLNFGLHSEEFSIMFSKVHNNLAQIKYNDEHLFSDSTNTITPNFWRAPTNNDIGAQKNIEFSKLHNLSYFYTSEIKNYNFSNGELVVNVEFTNPNFKDYSSNIKYIVNSSGSVKVQMSTKGLNEVFNFGVKASLNSKIKEFKYLGNGPYDSYVDRKEDMVKKYFTVDIGKQKQYIYPQEFGNKTQVDNLEFKISESKFKIELDNYEVSLKNYSDNSLTNSTHNWSLVEETPFLRINNVQAGVAGDDSWGSWAKQEYRAFVNQKFEFTIYR